MRIRRTSRLILVDGDGRVLLFKVEDATVVRRDEPSPTAHWMTPGGSLEPGEDHAAAARRELWEETGMTGVEPGQWVALCEPVLNWSGEIIQAHDRFFLTRVAANAVALDNLTDGERAVFREHRWWDVDALRASGEQVVPPDLVDLLPLLAAGQVPAEPIRLR
jgi:8-oxo-dGTP pyrophosphatase MutT (NUDIX family)